MTKRSWVQTLTMETIFQAPFIWIKAWNKNCGKTLTWHCCMCCNPANGRVDFEEWSAYKIHLHGIEWIVSLSADWDQSPTKKKIIICVWGVGAVKVVTWTAAAAKKYFRIVTQINLIGYFFSFSMLVKADLIYCDKIMKCCTLE
jgi:hypothetical protein